MGSVGTCPKGTAS